VNPTQTKTKPAEQAAAPQTDATEAPKQAPKAPVQEEKVIMQWRAPEFIKHPKGALWFAIAALGVALLIFYAIQTNSFTMALAFLVLAGVYLIAHHKDPGEIDVKITTLGIRAGQRKIPFNQIKAFWIVYHPPKIKTLKLLTTDKVLSEITIQLDGQEPGAVRDFMLKQVPEYEGRGENFIDAFIRITKL
jgi:hypothetical protein